MQEENEINNEALRNKAIHYFAQNSVALEQIRRLIEIRLKQLALVYTTKNKLPQESVIVTTRVKTLKSILQKLERKEYPHFESPKDIINDLIGARVTCWFLDDCMGMNNFILNSRQFHIIPKSEEDYIICPKESGYRSIHLLANVSYDSNAKTENGKTNIVHDEMICEIQVRTKLMDTWADLTHEFQYKAKALGIHDNELEKLLKHQATRFFAEDESFLAIRNVYQKMIDKTEHK